LCRVSKVHAKVWYLIYLFVAVVDAVVVASPPCEAVVDGVVVPLVGTTADLGCMLLLML
jgi:hypothetical protein